MARIGGPRHAGAALAGASSGRSAHPGRRAAAGRTERQPFGPAESHDGGPCSGRTRRAGGHGAGRRPLPARPRIDRGGSGQRRTCPAAARSARRRGHRGGGGAPRRTGSVSRRCAAPLSWHAAAPLCARQPAQDGGRCRAAGRSHAGLRGRGRRPEPQSLGRSRGGRRQPVRHAAPAGRRARASRWPRSRTVASAVRSTTACAGPPPGRTAYAAASSAWKRMARRGPMGQGCRRCASTICRARAAAASGNGTPRRSPRSTCMHRHS